MAAAGAQDSFTWTEGRPTERIESYGVSSGATSLARQRRGRRSRGAASNGAAANGAAAGSDGAGKLGMVEGVFFRVLTNLFGVILFLRLGWMVAYSGILVSIVIVVLCSGVTLITALSLSAICTNGKVAGGGAYYLISRALGPEFGASIGILFYVATAVSVSLYLLGFAETVVNQVEVEIIDEQWDLRIVAFLGLCFCQLVCLVGVSIVVKVEKVMLFVLLAAVVLFVAGMFRGPLDSDPYIGQTVLTPGRNLAAGNINAAMEPEDFSYLGMDDFDPKLCAVSPAEQLTEQYGFVNAGTTLAVFFPAVTGILAGANISGDLKNPSSAIPTGTILAIVIGGLMYVFLVILLGMGFYRMTVLEATAKNGTAGLMFDCEYGGLFFDTALVAESSIFTPFVYFGIYSASLSSGLAALLGAPRILQALAKDHLFATLDPLAQGYGASDEPLRAYAVTFVLAGLCILTGDINSVAPLITTFFLSSYAMVNYACYAAEESQSPGWRPTFRYFTKWLAFLGALGCITVMLYLSAITGFVTFTIGLALFKYVEVSTREGVATSWGPHQEAADYYTALKSALHLEQQPSGLQQQNLAPGLAPPGPVPRAAGGRRSSSTESEDLSTGATMHTEIELGAHNEIASQRMPSSHSFDDEDEGSSVGTGGGRGSFEKTQFSGSVPLLDSTHVKNYRPQCLVLAGPPRQRPALAVFVAGLRKARGVTVFGDVLVGDLSDPELLRLRNQRASMSYVSKYGIKAFNDVIIAPSFRTGCRSLLQISGLGRRMRVNTVVLGFLDDWRTPLSQRSNRERMHVEPSSRLSEEDGSTRVGVGPSDADEEDYAPPVSVVDYVGVIGDAFDLGLGVVILRGELDLLRSEYLTQTVRREMNRVLTLGMGSQRDHFGSHNGAYLNANYVDTEDEPPRLHTMLSSSSHESLDFDQPPAPRASAPAQRAQGGAGPAPGAVDGGVGESEDVGTDRKSAKRIDVWWLVDDGGLTIMLPHILRQAKSPPWLGCSLRVMAIGATEEEARKEEEDMRALLGKLRIKATVSVVSLSQFEALQVRAAAAAATAQDNRGRTTTTSAAVPQASNDGLENVTLQDDDDDDILSPHAVPGNKRDLQRQLFRAYSSMDETQNKSRRETYGRVGTLIAEFSNDALLVVVSLPVPPMSLDPEEYMHWLDLLSKDCEPPVLLVRGSQRDVVTIFS